LVSRGAIFWLDLEVEGRRPVFAPAQRLSSAVRAEYLPSGSVSSKVLRGLSGIALKVVEVIPDLLMNVSPTRSIVTL
jgi:hypothetical protein